MILRNGRFVGELCRQEAECGNVGERKLRINVCNSKVIRCSWSDDASGIRVRLNVELSEVTQYFKCMGSHDVK